MKRNNSPCRVLAAAGSEPGISAIKAALKGVWGQEELTVSHAFTISQVRQKISSYSGGSPADIMILKLPLRDEAGLEEILDIAQKNSRLQILLMVRREGFEQTAYRCRNYKIFVLSMPVQMQIMTQAVRFMLSIQRQTAEYGQEILRLKKKLGEIGYITKAKCLLIEKRGMTEEQAHYYLEREAMDRCAPKKEIALEIIRLEQGEPA